MITITDLTHTLNDLNSILAIAGANKRLTVQKQGSKYVVQCFQRLGSDEQRSRFIDNVVAGTARECVVGARAYAWKHAYMVTLDNNALLQTELALLREELNSLKTKLRISQDDLEVALYRLGWTESSIASWIGKPAKEEKHE